MDLPAGAPLLLAAARPSARADWLGAAAGVLRRSGRMSASDPDTRAVELLSSTDPDGLAIPALGEPGPAVEHDHAGPGQAPFTRGASRAAGGGWDIRPYLADPDPGSAAAAAVADLEGGATSLWLRVGGGGSAVAQLDRVLTGVHLDLAPVMLQPAGDVGSVEVTAAFAGTLRRRGLRAHPDSNLGADQLARFIRSGAARGDAPLALVKPVGRTVTDAADLGVRGFVVDATVAHERGAGHAAELGYSLAAGVAYLRAMDENGLGLLESLRLMEFRYAATDDQFTTIAKFRAARLLWDRVAQASGAGADRPGQVQHATTSRLMMTRYDSFTNLLRTTLAAFAAGVGGATSVTALPFDFTLGVPDALGRRLARNISHLLISEAHVAAAADPAGGASAVESLTRQLAEAGWAEFQQIEAAGSVTGAIHDRSLLRRWDAAADRREELVATRLLPITGVSEFPQPHERLPTRRERVPGTDGGQFYAPWAEPFEAMRDRPVVGSVLMATVGPTTTSAARAGFMRNAFAAGGIDTVERGPVTGVTEMLAAYRDAGRPEVVCLTGSDRSYADLGTDVVHALRAVGADRILLAGRPAGPLAGLVDDHLAAGDDVVEFLLRTRHAMGFPDKPMAESEAR